MTTRSIADQGVGGQCERDRQPGLTPDEVVSVISLAARAPSLHNTQPWRFRQRPECVEVFADLDRNLTEIDPAGRELMISCGAAVFGLRLGLRRVGRLPCVALQPDPAQPLLLARVWPAGHAARTPAEADLIAAVPHRHTHRGPFSPGEVPARLLESLVTDAAAEGCELVFITDLQAVARLGRLVRRAGAEQRANPEMSAEQARWVRPLGSQARDGVPATARLADARSRPHLAAPQVTGRLAQRDFGLPGTEQPGGESALTTAVLMTSGDTPADWLRAGQALDRLLLRAAARWVFASLQSQPIESPRHRRAVRVLAGGNGFPQLLLQFGRANTAAATPRRPLAEMLVTD